MNPKSPPIPRRQFIASLPGLGIIAAQSGEAKPLQDILFGSCLDTHEHPMLDQTLTLPRDLFLFMGDNIYADKGGIPMMQEKYALLKKSRFFQGLTNKPILATWDDHDFGENDGGSSYPYKNEAQAEFWNWLDEPADSSRRLQKGVYHSQTFGPEGKKTQVIMLDTRTFRGALTKAPKEVALLGGPHIATTDLSTTMLGEIQWKWLETTLRQPADLRLIVSSIQFAPELHGGECWANLPHEQQHLLDLLKQTRAAGVVILSGDRHWCEFSKIDGPSGYPLYDFTSSSLTQKHPRGTPTPNQNRWVPKSYHLPNVGHLRVDWNTFRITVRIIDAEGGIQMEHELSLNDLQPR